MNPPQSLASRIARILTLGWSDSPAGRRILRSRAVGLVRGALDVRSVPLPFHGLRSILVVAPHPDDESLGCGGTVALMARRGVDVHVAFVTDGRASHPGHRRLGPPEIAAMRRAEALNATSALGVGAGRVIFLEAADGTLASLLPGARADLERRIAAVITAARPDTILVTCRGDGSSEHDATSEMVVSAVRKARARARILEFPIWAWRNPLLLLEPLVFARAAWSVDITPVLSIKSEAIRSHASQLLPLPPDAAPVLAPEFAAEFQFPREYFFER